MTGAIPAGGDERNARTTDPAPSVPAGHSPIATKLLAEPLRAALGVVANVTVLAALLLYFGWRRSETHASRLGIDENILGMSTRDYLLRSVGPVLLLLVGVAAAGLAWIWMDGYLAPFTRARGYRDRRVRLVLGGFSLAWIVLPIVVYVLGFWWATTPFVLFPASIAVGVLLALYGRYLRGIAGDPREAERPSVVVAGVFAGLLGAVCLFWTASNYAEVLGTRLARNFAANVARQPGVIVLSDRPLDVDAPGLKETEVGAGKSAPRYRYTGFRLLEHTGGKFFLVSDGWTPTYGVVVVLADDDRSLRFDFVRDRRGA